MTDKTKNLILKIILAVVITVAYFYAACIAGTFISVIFLSFSVLIPDEMSALTWVLIFAPPVLFFTFIDNLLFEPLCKLFEHSALVYTVLSGNFMTLYGIFAMINGFASSGENYSGFKVLGAVMLVIPVTSLLGGILFCFLIRLFKSRKAKGISDSESAKEYVK